MTIDNKSQYGLNVVDYARDYILKDAFLTGITALSTSRWNFNGDEFYDTSLLPVDSLELSPEIAIVGGSNFQPGFQEQRYPIELPRGKSVVLRGFIPYLPANDDNRKSTISAEVTDPRAKSGLTIYSLEGSSLQSRQVGPAEDSHLILTIPMAEPSTFKINGESPVGLRAVKEAWKFRRIVEKVAVSIPSVIAGPRI